MIYKFCYLGGLLSRNTRIDDEVTARIVKASAALRRLQKRVWSDHGICLTTKVAVYRTIALSILSYGCERWTWYSDHVKKLDHFHLRWLRKICGISWRDKVPNTSVLECCEIKGIKSILVKSSFAGQAIWFRWKTIEFQKHFFMVNSQ